MTSRRPQASVAITDSGTSGRWTATRSPARTPSRVRAAAALAAWSSSSAWVSSSVQSGSLIQRRATRAACSAAASVRELPRPRDTGHGGLLSDGGERHAAQTAAKPSTSDERPLYAAPDPQLAPSGADRRGTGAGAARVSVYDHGRTFPCYA